MHSNEGAVGRVVGWILTFVVMMGLWVIFSGRFDSFHLSLGVISSAMVATMSGELLFPSPRVGHILATSWRFVAYLPWLIWQIVLANFHVLKLVLHPRMHELISPRLVRFPSILTTDYSRTTLAHSITLTPGTITVYVTVDGQFTVHAIDAACGDLQALKEMEARVARVFRQG